MKKRLIWIAPLAIVGLVVFVAIGGFLVQLLWNWLLPTLFGWPTLSFWQALGILALCRILFGGIGGRGMSGSHVRRRVADRVADRVAERMDERWGHMTPEERERFRQGMHASGSGPSTSGSRSE
jgi:membrane protein required for beta-lactamase induction